MYVRTYVHNGRNWVHQYIRTLATVGLKSYLQEIIDTVTNYVRTYAAVATATAAASPIGFGKTCFRAKLRRLLEC